ncbi:hypothetical protein [Chryseobacterium salviniae]|uniref:Lipoprotein n=1 Tax=Chryseobacterium salviniae TaxID=3101750 RepID=A0ABU6HVF6_9FLAO|nr:hypothetical protein [Chryseobacterium sp. T9W2-O]MEC3877054.1 hypothetical protein [Chryseobacterium sp. T9W2-O]
MMKKISWLFLLTVFLTLFSCRNDVFPEQEAYSNSSKFQLTSKRISLNESKHKVKLLPELEKAKHGFEAKNTAGKVVHYGNGVSINTDDVIYIENGPNYYTYTFKIERENAPENAPVENLVLSPLSDGTLREMLITYNLTEQEKQTMNAGGMVDLSGKVSYTPLESGTYSSAMKQDMICYYKTISYYTSCSEGVHNHGEASDEDGGPCQAETQSVLVITVTRVCEMVGGGGTGEGVPPGVTNPQGGGTGGGTTEPGGSNGSANTSQPCDGNGIISQPQDPGTTLESQTGCNTGTPTLPNLGGNLQTQTPCEKIKAQRNDDNFKKRMDTLQGKTGLKKETGYIQKWGGAYVYKDNASATDDANSLTMPDVSTNTYIKGFMHTHVNDYTTTSGDERKGIKMFSPADAAYFMDLVKNAQTKGQSLSDVYGVMVSSLGNYQIRFTGNQYQIKTFTDTEAAIHRDPFAKAMEDHIKSPDKLELAFLKYIQEKMLLYGITLYRMNSDGTTTEIKLNADKTDTVKNICPI